MIAGNQSSSTNKVLTLPKNEKERLRALDSYFILDTEEEKEFDRLTQLAAIICEVPIAAVSLIDENRQWFKSKVGINASHSKREFSFCQFAILGKGIFEVQDAAKDERFKKNLLVNGEQSFRFYAGYPLIDPDGFALGTLCVIDYKPKKLNETQQLALSTLAKEVVSHIVSRKDHFDKFNFEELFVRSIDLVCLASIDGFFKKVNPAFSVVLGWSSKELTEKPFLDFVHPDDKQKTIFEMSKLSHGVRVINFSNRYLTKSGAYKILNWVANPDLVKGIIYATARDKTEIVHSQEQLFQAEKKFKDLFDNSPDAIFVEDGCGNILDVNPAAVELQGIPKEELIGINIKNLVPGEKYVKLLRDYKKLFFGLVKTVESTLWSKSNGEVPVEVSGKKIYYEGKDVLLLLVRDISERKKIERERAQVILEKSLQREEQIKTSLRIQEEERNRIAAEMHDEVGAGLSKISILGQVIKKSFNDPDVVAANIDKVILSSQHIQENISEIIWAMNPKYDSLENLISYINYYALEFLENSSIRVKIILPENIPAVRINGKSRRNIFLIIKESMNNIIKYAKATNVILDIYVDNGLLSVFISDNGIGFDTEKIPRFSNGIQNMKNRISEVGGFLNIDSKFNAGTIVFLYVPIVAISTE